jgi:RNA polymerase sigma-70 factor (ECF subfamily)
MEPPHASEPPAFGEGEAEARELAALRAGDEGAFLALVGRHHAAMLRVASLYVKSRASAEEAVQEAWLAVLSGLARFEGRSSLRSWIFGIVANCARRRAGRDARAVPLSALAPPDDDGPAVPAERFLGPGEEWAGHWAVAPEPWPDARLESSELVALVREGLGTLPEAQRAVMSLRDVEGWEAAEVCELLGLSEGNQRVLLHRARSRVRGYVEERLREEGR